MRYYFELPQGDGMQYVWCQSFGLQYDVQKGLTYRAHRIWEEDDRGQIIYLKNRSISPETQVDLKEFFWVKLQSQPYNRSHT